MMPWPMKSTRSLRACGTGFARSGRDAGSLAQSTLMASCLEQIACVSNRSHGPFWQGLPMTRRPTDFSAEIDTQLREGSPLGARLIAQGSGDRPSGESTQGGVWHSINHTLVWAAAATEAGAGLG